MHNSIVPVPEEATDDPPCQNRGRPKKIVGRGRNKMALGFTGRRRKKKWLMHSIYEDMHSPVQLDVSPSLVIGDRGVKCVTTRATKVWETGKFCGLDFPG